MQRAITKTKLAKWIVNNATNYGRQTLLVPLMPLSVFRVGVLTKWWVTMATVPPVVSVNIFRTQCVKTVQWDTRNRIRVRTVATDVGPKRQLWRKVRPNVYFVKSAQAVRPVSMVVLTIATFVHADGGLLEAIIASLVVREPIKTKKDNISVKTARLGNLVTPAHPPHARAVQTVFFKTKMLKAVVTTVR